RANHGAVEEHRLIVAADGETVADTQSIVSRLEGNLNDLPFLHTDHCGVVVPRTFGELDPHVRLAELFAHQKVLRRARDGGGRYRLRERFNVVSHLPGILL